MSAGPASAVFDARQGSPPHLASSGVVVGVARIGLNSGVAEGTVVRSSDGAVQIGTGSRAPENSVLVGYAQSPALVGRLTVFGSGAW
jgi:carbonic anhydrase/acetyltransferase-like protein (isoleucine patch superfamily)